MARLGFFNVMDPYQVSPSQTTPQSNAGRQQINNVLPFINPRTPFDPGVPTTPTQAEDPVEPDMPDPNAPLSAADEPAGSSPDMPDPGFERPNISGIMGLRSGPSTLVYGDQPRQGTTGGGAMSDLSVFTNPMLAMGSELLGRNVSQYNQGGMMNPYQAGSFEDAFKNRMQIGKQLGKMIADRKKRFTEGGRF